MIQRVATNPLSLTSHPTNSLGLEPGRLPTIAQNQVFSPNVCGYLSEDAEPTTSSAEDAFSVMATCFVRGPESRTADAEPPLLLISREHPW
jgi:hypothetical protein